MIINFVDSPFGVTSTLTCSSFASIAGDSGVTSFRGIFILLSVLVSLLPFVSVATTSLSANTAWCPIVTFPVVSSNSICGTSLFSDQTPPFLFAMNELSWPFVSVYFTSNFVDSPFGVTSTLTCSSFASIAGDSGVTSFRGIFILLSVLVSLLPFVSVATTSLSTNTAWCPIVSLPVLSSSFILEIFLLIVHPLPTLVAVIVAGCPFKST